MNKLMKILYGIIALLGVAGGGINFARASNDAATTSGDVAWETAKNPLIAGGVAALVAAAQFGVPRLRGAAIGSSGAATTMALKTPELDIAVSLTGDAQTDAEGLKRIGAVLDYYASRKGGAK